MAVIGSLETFAMERLSLSATQEHLGGKTASFNTAPPPPPLFPTVSPIQFHSTRSPLHPRRRSKWGTMEVTPVNFYLFFCHFTPNFYNTMWQGITRWGTNDIFSQLERGNRAQGPRETAPSLGELVRAVKWGASSLPRLRWNRDLRGEAAIPHSWKATRGYWTYGERKLTVSESVWKPRLHPLTARKYPF